MKIKSTLIFLMLLISFTLSANYSIDWKQMKNGTAIDIDTDYKGNIYIVGGKSRRIWKWSRQGQTWKSLAHTPVKVNRVCATNNEAVFALGAGQVYRLVNKKWEKRGQQKFDDIAVGSNGDLWGISKNRKEISLWDRKQKKWKPIRTTGTIVEGRKPRSIAVYKNGAPFVNFWDNSVAYYSRKYRKWKPLDGKAIAISCSPKSEIHVVRPNNEMFKLNLKSNFWPLVKNPTNLDISIRSFALLPNGSPVVAAQNEKIYRRVKTSTTTFLPSKHGYKFKNGWTASAKIVLDSDLAKSFIPREYRSYEISGPYGLCGGMSLGALEHYKQKRSIPSTTTSPAKGTDLYDYLLNRQYNSFGEKYEYLEKTFTWWLCINGEDELPQLSKKSMDKLQLMIHRNEPMLLSLIYKTKTRGGIWENHQVVAYAYEHNFGSTRIKIYDPNYPGDNEVSINLWVAPKSGKYYIDQTGPKKKKIYGMFFTDPPQESVDHL